MEESSPIYPALLCVARCVIPALILLGISYLLRRFGFIAKPAPPPSDYENNETDE